jgi:uncharacterized damage-inducible protein DinB
VPRFARAADTCIFDAAGNRREEVPLKETLERLFKHLVWADGKAVECLRANPGSQRKALEVFAHLLEAGKLWLARIGGAGDTPVAVWNAMTLEECEAESKAQHAALAALLERTSEADLGRPVTYTTSRGEHFANTLGDVLLHLALHGAYHRGQVAQAVRASGGKPVNTDYINFVRSPG